MAYFINPDAPEKRKILYCRESSPGRVVCSMSLYRLSYSGCYAKILLFHVFLLTNRAPWTEMQWTIFRRVLVSYTFYVLRVLQCYVFVNSHRSLKEFHVTVILLQMLKIPNNGAEM
jgi:hypothetical protein